MNQIELLAPARDLETGIAAINCGADAVYLGAPRFGAREAAGNDLPTIEKLVQYAHKYWARVYVTVNTLLHDSELNGASQIIQQVYDLGADAVIIQDAGLLECDLPPIPLFASTQMHNHTPERIAFLEKVGVQRAILARELSIEQIQAIRAATGMELECFIHGSLCVSYSGQCYLSYSIGGRSGNRGQCAQPCRQRYSLVDASGRTLVKDRYLLSLRDLNLTFHLLDLLASGVTSFEIEGRLKDKAYVMNVVSHYRRRLDEILEGSTWQRSSSGATTLDFTPDLHKTFNRGFTSYFVKGRGDPVASPDTPKSTGEPLGKVLSIRQGAVIIDTTVELHPGDGICFYDEKRELQGATINRVEGRSVTLYRSDGLAPGVFVYRNHDHQFLSLLEKSRADRKIAVSFRLEEHPAGLELHARDEDGNQASSRLDCEKIPAEKPEQAAASIEKQLGKLGDTEFTCQEVDVHLSRALFVPLSVLNQLRREAVSRLAQAREANRPRREGGARVNAAPFPAKELDFTGNVLNRKAEEFYRRHGVTRIEPAAETGLDLRGRRVMTTKLCLRYQQGACPKQPGSIRLDEPLHLVDEQGGHFALRFNCAACEMEIYRGIPAKSSP